MISLEATKEFQDIWKEEFGEEIPEDLAMQEGINLLTIFNAIYEPIKQEWFDDYENEHGTYIKTIFLIHGLCLINMVQTLCASTC